MSKLLDRFRYFKTKATVSPMGTGRCTTPTATGRTATVNAGSSIKLCDPPTALTAPAPVAGRFMSKWHGDTETQQTDYPRTRPDLPNHEPRGCPRGASYSRYLYSANRLKYPLVRRRLIELWREALAQHTDPVLAGTPFRTIRRKRRATGRRAVKAVLSAQTGKSLTS